MNLFLIVDVTKPRQITFFLFFNNKKKAAKIFKSKHPNFLVLFDKFLSARKKRLEKLACIVLLAGEGSFSNVRQAAAVLNMIKLIKKIPLLILDKRNYLNEEYIFAAARDGFKKGAFVFIKPIYFKEPNISKSKITKPKN